MVEGGETADSDDLTVLVEEDDRQFSEIEVGVDGNLHGIPDDLVSECEALLDAVVAVGENDGFSDAALTGDGVLGGGLLLCHDVFSLSVGGL